ncbi:MAG: hypothetical protein ACTS8S_02525, partial [Giesbergeria sp.]
MTLFNWGPQHRLYAICNPDRQVVQLPDVPNDDIKVTKLDTLFPCSPTCEDKQDSKYVKLFGQPLTRVCKDTWNLDLGFISATIQFDATNTLEPWRSQIVGKYNKSSRNFSDILEVERWAEIQLIAICEEILQFVPPIPQSRQKPTSNITNVPRQIAPQTPRLFGQNMIADATGWVLRLGTILAKISSPDGESQWVAALGHSSEKLPTIEAAETWIEQRASEMYSTLGSFVFNRPPTPAPPEFEWLPLPKEPINCNAFVVKHAGSIVRELRYFLLYKEGSGFFSHKQTTGGSRSSWTWGQI